MAVRGMPSSAGSSSELAGIFVGLTLAGEKMPWLESYIVLLMALLAPLRSLKHRGISRSADAAGSPPPALRLRRPWPSS
jgi:hypothetical protein